MFTILKQKNAQRAELPTFKRATYKGCLCKCWLLKYEFPLFCYSYSFASRVNFDGIPVSTVLFPRKQALQMQDIDVVRPGCQLLPISLENMDIPGSEPFPSWTSNSHNLPGRTISALLLHLHLWLRQVFGPLGTRWPRQGPRSICLAEKTVDPMLLQFVCPSVIWSKPVFLGVAHGGTWFWVTPIWDCAWCWKNRAASAEFRGVNDKDCSHWTAARVPPRSILVLVTWRCMWGRSQPNTRCQPSLNDATPAANSETLGFPTPVSFKASFVSKDQDEGYKWKQQWAHLRNQLTFQYIHSFPMLGVQRQLLKICQPWGASHETRPLQPHRTASSPPLSCGKSRLKYFRTQIYTYTYIHI